MLSTSIHALFSVEPNTHVLLVNGYAHSKVYERVKQFSINLNLELF